VLPRDKAAAWLPQSKAPSLHPERMTDSGVEASALPWQSSLEIERHMMKSDRTFTHLSPNAAARMVDVGSKRSSHRSALAEAWVNVGSETAARMQREGGLAKGNVLETARIAGIMAAKKTPELIPMCHPLVLDAVDVETEIVDDRIRILARVTCEGKTGVEMEAMTAASIAALTVYDMVKSAGKGVEIGPVRLLEKQGGKSGDWRREENSDGSG
jgi:cyclic pyranopterin monophosphate synthase